MLKVFVRLVADAALVAFLLFASAGTIAWQRAWLLVVVLLVVRIVSAVVVYRVNPALLRERARLPIHGDQPWSDKMLLLLVITTGFLGLPVVAGCDVFRWHVLPPPGTLVSALGLVLFVLGWVIKGMALRANAFATSVVRLQHERKHAVADTGVYAIVRHPMYATAFLYLVGTPLALGSYWGLVPIAAMTPLLIWRLADEERFLARDLPGYTEYRKRVRHRLVPHVW